MIRFLQKFLLIVVIGACAVLILVLVASQMEQHSFGRRAELLLSHVQSLELRKTPWPEALRRLKRWKRQSKFDDRCNETECSIEIALFDPVYGSAYKDLFFVHLDDYLRWRLKLSYDRGPFARIEEAISKGYMVLGGRPAKITASAGMREGVMWSKGYSATIETFRHEIPEADSDRWFEYSLIATAHSVQQIDFTRQNAGGPQVQLHPNYLISRPGGCEGCIFGFVLFTPYADPVEIRRLMQLDLSCLTRMRPCRDQNDIMPAAWKQYLAERSKS